MNNKIKTILMAAIMSSVVLTQGVCVSAAQFDDGASAFSDGTGSVSALASTLAKQTEEQTQEFVAKEEEAAQIREERRVEKAEKASEKAEQEKTAALESIQQTVEDTKKKIAEEAEAKRLAKRQEVVNFALQFEGNPYVYGGTSLTNGADCSGFVMSVFANFGYSLPRVAAAQCGCSTLLFGSLLARLYKHIHIYSEKVKNRAYYYKEMKNRVEITLFAAYAVENDSECICYTA